MSPKLALLPAALALALHLAACGTLEEDPLLRLSATESLEKGTELLKEEKYARARPYFIHAFEVEPNSVNGRQALLLAADTFFLDGGQTNHLQAEAKYRDFINRFPTSDRAAYAQFQIGNSLAENMERPDRDQANTRKALEAYREVLRLYPTSAYAAQAREQIQRVRDNLAEHEFMVAHFYLRFGLPRATVSRLEGLLDEYPEYQEKDKALFFLGRAYARLEQLEDSQSTFRRLRSQYPESPYVKELPREKAAVEEAGGTQQGGEEEGP